MGDDDGILQRGAAGEPGGPERVDLVQEAEGAGPAQLVLEGAVDQIDLAALPGDGAGAVIDLEIDGEALGWAERGAAPPGGKGHGAQDLDEAARGVELDHPGTFDQEDEGPGAAVHDRQLGPMDLDHQIVDAAAGQGRHDMLDGGNLDALDL